MYQLIVQKRAEKDLNRISEKDRSKIMTALFDLREDPYIGKVLKGGLVGYRSLRVWPYRIIYRINKKKLMVLVVKIGHRQGIYK